MDQERLSHLNDLQGEAKRGTLYLALLLIGVLCFFLFLGPIWGVGLASLTLVLHLLALRPAQKRYWDAAQEARLIASCHGLENAVYTAEAPFDAKSVHDRGLMPMNEQGLMLRYGLSGRTENLNLRMSDISCIYTFSDGRGKRAAAFSGCLIDADSPEDCGYTAVFCPANLLPQKEMDAYYAASGLIFRNCGFAGWRIYEDPERPMPKDVMEGLQGKLSLLGDAVFRFDKAGCSSLVLHRFLNCGEPDLKKPWTQERLQENALPWLTDWLDAVREAVSFTQTK